ncbi:MAG TPA: GAF domain-containing sensor histidine kinase [Actinomycetota bacterium]|nr:GAF domain-containing sensor histidine kinase [Actinomycetota bacterium]
MTERKLAEAALRRKTAIVELVKTVAVAANEASDIEGAMQTTVDAVCSYNGWPVGHVYLNDPSHGHLVSMGIWHLDDPERYSSFKKLTEAGGKLEGLGPAGAARASGQLEWITDVTQDPAFSRAQEAGAAGLRSGFAFPLLVEQEVVGVFEFFAQHHAARDESFQDVIAPLATQLGHAVQRKRIEQELRRLDVAKTEFIGNAAHELRTPLSVLTGVTQILVKQHRKLSVKERDEMFAMMDRQSERMRTLINNLLDITGMDFGRLKIDLRPVPLREAVESALAANPPPDGWDVGTDVPEDLKVIADDARLDQVFTNLIQNAFKYGSEKLRIEARATTKDVRVSVCNLGAPVPPELVGGLFDPFTRGEHQAARGSGLGLTICKRIIEAFGGSIWYEPNESGGSRFEIRLSKP